MTRAERVEAQMNRLMRFEAEVQRLRARVKELEAEVTAGLEAYNERWESDEESS